jgi:hypothetical protein
MTELQNMELPPSTFRVFGIGSLVVILILVLSSGIQVEDMHAILNTYIIIEIAIISVAFVAMSMKQNERDKETYKNLFGLVGISTIFLFCDVLAYFYSFIKSTPNFDLVLSITATTWFTFLSIFFMFAAFMEFNPEKRKDGKTDE